MLAPSMFVAAAATRSSLQHSLPLHTSAAVLTGLGGQMRRHPRPFSTSTRYGAPQPSGSSPASQLSYASTAQAGPSRSNATGSQPEYGSTPSSNSASRSDTAARSQVQTETALAEARDVVHGEVHPKGSYLLFHPVYSESDLDSVRVVHREAKTMGDRIAGRMVWLARSIFDLATRYPGHRSKKFPPLKDDGHRKVDLPRHIAAQRERYHQLAKDGQEVQLHKASRMSVQDVEEGMTLQQMRKKGLVFGPDAWLNRIIFLETIAGVPGMVAAACRHLQSLRLMKRDKGWIHTMLEDAENERMHLLTFMTIAKPGVVARTFALLAQGVFYNFFFFFYLVAPRVAHRFVGKLEEEAVHTYTRILEDIHEGRLPEWDELPAPQIARQYWQLAPDAKFVDVVRAVRADEATHRHINHTFASLESTDPNPFAHRVAPAKMRGESYGLERDEALRFASEADQKANRAADKTA